MANRIVTATVTGETIKLSSKNAGASGSFNAVSLALTFDSAWDGTTSKIVQFLDKDGANPVNITLTSGMLVSGAYIVPIPAEPLVYAGEMTVTVRGVDFEVDGTTAERIIVCASTTMKVLNSLYEVGGATPVEPTPTQAEQLSTAVNSVTGMTVSATALATGAPATVTKTTNVDETINLAFGLPAGGKGDTGDIGLTGATGATGATGNPGAVYQASEPTGVVLWVDSDDDEPSTITKANIGLGSVDNTSDVNKPISTATQTALTAVTTSISELNADISTLNSSIFDFDNKLRSGKIKVPSSFGVLPCEIIKQKNVVTHNFTVDGTGYTSVYISNTGGAYSGLTEAQPITLVRFVDNYNGGVYSAYQKIKLVMLDAVYRFTLATLNKLDLDLIIEPKTGSTWVGRMYDKTHTSYFTGEWGAYNSISRITMAYNFGIVDCINIDNLDNYGIPKRYFPASSIVNCEATKGTYYKDGTNLKLYCNPYDGDVVAKLYIIQDASALDLTVKSGRSAIFKNINFVTSSYTFIGESIISKFYFSGCKFFGGKQDAFHLAGDYLAYLFECVAAYGSKDCFNYYKGTDTGTMGFEINCIGYGAGKYKLTGGNITTNSNNGSTAHNGMKVARIGCKYFNCEGPIVADADNCYSINIGCVTGRILPTTDGVKAGFYMYNSGQTANNQYIFDCYSDNGTDYDVGYDVSGDVATTYVDNAFNRNKSQNVIRSDLVDVFIS